MMATLQVLFRFYLRFVILPVGPIFIEGIGLFWSYFLSTVKDKNSSPKSGWARAFKDIALG